MRWRFTIAHVAGKANGAADATSRHPSQPPEEAATARTDLCVQATADTMESEMVADIRSKALPAGRHYVGEAQKGHFGGQRTPRALQMDPARLPRGEICTAGRVSSLLALSREIVCDRRRHPAGQTNGHPQACTPVSATDPPLGPPRDLGHEQPGPRLRLLAGAHGRH
jgi:hypothetical protein